MKQFISMLKKELKELLTLQMLLPLIIGSMIFVMLGNIVGAETKKMAEPQMIFLIDFDNTQSSALVVLALENSNFIIEMIKPSSSNEADETDKAIQRAKDEDIGFLLSIGKGFEQGLDGLEQQNIKTYSIVKNFSITSGVGSAKVSSTLSAINNYLSGELIKEYSGQDIDPEVIKSPVISIDNTIVGNNIAQINPGEVTSFIMSQTIFIPIIMFIIIIFSSQMIGVSVASEKENKTLETLLSTPISRMTLVTAKMVAAAIAALVMAGVYMFGFSFYMEGMSGGALTTGQNTQGAIEALGLTIGTGGYMLIGLSLFLSILIALAIAMILGAFAEDVKKVQGLLSPIIFVIMIPYLLSMFVDIPNASLAIKVIIYIIPFSYTFLAAPNMFLQNYSIIYIGAIYQFVLFIVLAVIATRIFSSDKILTLKLSFGKKK